MLGYFDLSFGFGNACLEWSNEFVDFCGGEAGSDVFRAIPVVGNNADADDAPGDFNEFRLHDLCHLFRVVASVEHFSAI